MRFNELRVDPGPDPENPYDQYKYLEDEFEKEMPRIGRGNHAERGRTDRRIARRKRPTVAEERLAPGAFAVSIQLEEVEIHQHDRLLDDLHECVPEELAVPSRLRQDGVDYAVAS